MASSSSPSLEYIHLKPAKQIPILILVVSLWRCEELPNRFLVIMEVRVRKERSEPGRRILVQEVLVYVCVFAGRKRKVEKEDELRSYITFL